ncbi:PhnB protein [Microbispora rosea]|uniref:PhnB protein n=2 Tax=Microbispora rosea TaxID=58117 RepID=A0A1N6YDW6_9ACTN|nr:glyoxalase [Microbispora rosea subsp. rosea]SIR12691.1 PhnB protein [Microbispora rosea]
MAADTVSPHYRSGTPLIAVHDAPAALDFYQAAFGAQPLARLDAPDGRVMHAAILIYGSPVVVADEMPEVGLHSPHHYGGTAFSIILACEDADAAHARAVAAGALSLAPVQEDFSGSRHGLVQCPFGHRWLTTSRTEALSFDQINDRFQAWLAAGEPIELSQDGG